MLVGGFAAGAGGFESDLGGEAETGGEATAVAEVGSEEVSMISTIMWSKCHSEQLSY